MSDEAAAFQSRACNNAPKGKGFYRNGVQFDGVDHNKSLLLDAKYYPDGSPMSRALESESWWSGNKALEQALRQLKAANGVAVEWRVAGQVAAKQLEALFKANKVPIRVVHFP